MKGTNDFSYIALMQP